MTTDSTTPQTASENPAAFISRQITLLFANPSEKRLQVIQQHLQRRRLPYNVMQIDGRLALMHDLIVEQLEAADAAQRSEIALAVQTLECLHDGSWSLENFCIEYLRELVRGWDADPSKRPAARKAAARARKNFAASLVLALSMSGMMSSGCSQQKEAQAAMRATPASRPISIVSHMPATHAKSLRRQSQSVSTYRVKKGDSVSGIAQQLKVDYRTLVQLNNLDYDDQRDWFVLYPGQELRLPRTMHPARAADDSAYLRTATAAAGHQIHVIQRGESLWTIAHRYDISIKQLAAINNVQNPELIRFGQVLKIPRRDQPDKQIAFEALSQEQKVQFLRDRTIKAGHQYLETLVALAEEYKIDPRLYASLIWEESWFNSNARSPDNCRKLVQLDPRFHEVSDSTEQNFRRSLSYLRHEFSYYRDKGYDRRAATLCSLAAYNGGNTRIRRYIREGAWDGTNIHAMPLKETREYLIKILERCEQNYQAIL